MVLSKDEVYLANTFFMSEGNALEYLSSKGIEMAGSTWYLKKRQLKEKAREFLYEKAKSFDAHHMEQIKLLEYVQEEMYDNYQTAKESNKLELAHRILKDLAEIQYIISDYNEATKFLMQNEKKAGSLQKTGKLSE